MPNINKSILNNNFDFIQFKHSDFSDEKINHKKSFQKDSINPKN